MTMTLLRLILVVVTLSHLVLGLIAALAAPATIASVTAMTYGASITVTPEFRHAIRILGAFMIAIGIMAAFAFRDPVRNRAIIDGIGILQLIRVAQRVFLASHIEAVFKLPPGRLLAQSLFFLMLGVLLLALRPAAPSRSGRG